MFPNQQHYEKGELLLSQFFNFINKSVWWTNREREKVEVGNWLSQKASTSWLLIEAKEMMSPKLEGDGLLVEYNLVALCKYSIIFSSWNRKNLPYYSSICTGPHPQKVDLQDY